MFNLQPLRHISTLPNATPDLRGLPPEPRSPGEFDSQLPASLQSYGGFVRLRYTW